MKMDSIRAGKRIQESRRGQGLTQEQLAERVGISVGHMSNIENGKTGFSLGVLTKLRMELGVPVDMLLFGPPAGEDEIYGMAARELGALLKGCTKTQALAVLDFIHSTGVLLRQCGVGAGQDPDKGKGV